MIGISFIIITSGTNDKEVQLVVDSIDNLNIPNFEIVIVGGLSTTLTGRNIIHVPFDETIKPVPWTTRKKNLGVQASKYNTVVIQHDYYAYDSNWYEEYIKFGEDWDICVQQTITLPEQGNARANGWRGGPIPGYPEIPYSMTIPWDIDCFVPYMAIQGSFWVAKKHVMLEQPLDENLVWGQSDDIEWSSRVVPGWLGQKPNQNDYKVVSNPKCVTRFTKVKPPYPGNPDWEQMERQLEPLWNFLRVGGRRVGVYHYDNHKIALYQILS